ncbi:hypothetical protein BBJ28_00003622 [Nothophytophthora sp. Chile5]|nr:hypothetical protein BBJ28_00003622 [Nothophytophthora sp. Chile5]
MPKRIAWQDLALGAPGIDADKVLGAFKTYDVSKSNLYACTICLDDTPHMMRYRMLKCSSTACKAVVSSGVRDCTWRGKSLSCQVDDAVSIFEVGERATAVNSPKKKRLTDTQKTYCRELTTQHLRSVRIRRAMARKFGAVLQDLPSLDTVQNFVNYYSRTNLSRNDSVDDLRAWIHARAYTGRESMTQTFTFAWNLDEQGKPVVGNGSEERPFVIGLTTKALVLRLMRSPNTYILHVDATFKLNYRGYPVLVVGISDRSRGFHLVALYIVSGETQKIIQPMFMALKRLYGWLTGRDLVVRYAMADADKAQYNAVNAVLGDNPQFLSLMCFFHVMEKVCKAIKPFPSFVSSDIIRDLYDLHFARTHLEFTRMRDALLRKWMTVPILIDFAQYMSGQWLGSRFSGWQLYSTPSGFASTNNPVETFNSILKRDYTLRRCLKMGALLAELSNCCEDQSANERPFRLEVIPTEALIRRVRELVRENLLGLGGDQTGSFGRPGCLRVASRLAKRIVVAPNNRSEEGIAVSAQMGLNYARMEVEGQPNGGWTVDLSRRWCECNYCYAFGVCVHVLYAVRTLDYIDGSGREILVSRNKQKNNGVATSTNLGQRGGRPTMVGPALTF